MDTSLLQYAINTDEELGVEARRQAAKFANRVFFKDR